MESNLSSTMLCNNIAGLFDEKLKSNNYNVNQSWIDLFQNQTKQWLTSEHLRPLVFGFYHSYLIELTDLNIYFKIFLYLVYACIFTIGLIGNILVCYVIFRQSSMHSVTYIYIANLALVDILICLFAVPFTPMYLMTFKEWIFGTTLCRLVPFAQGNVPLLNLSEFNKSIEFFFGDSNVNLHINIHIDVHSNRTIHGDCSSVQTTNRVSELSSDHLYHLGTGFHIHFTIRCIY